MAEPGVIENISISDLERYKFTRNSSNKIAVDVIGELKGTGVLKTGETFIAQYNEITDPIYNVETTIVSYTVPMGLFLYLGNITGSGDNKAVYSVYVDGAVVAKKRSWWMDFNVEFDLSDISGVRVTEGKVIQLRVVNKTNSSADFNGTITGITASE